MEIKEELIKVFIVKDINDREKVFLNEKEALEFEEETLEKKIKEKIQIFCNSAFPSYQYGKDFDIDDIKEALFKYRDFYKQLDI